MLKSKSSVLLLTFTVMIGLSITSILQPPQAAHSQTDYEEYLIVEDINQQGINQQNTGSGQSTNNNCAANLIDSTTEGFCNTINNGPAPPPSQPTLVMTPRTETFSTPVNPGATITVTAECLEDEVITGGGWTYSPDDPDDMEIVRNEPSGNAWSLTARLGDFGGGSPNLTVYAMCLKIADPA